MNVLAEEERARQGVRALRSLSTALNLLATEIETTRPDEAKLQAWGAQTWAYAEIVEFAAARLKGEKT